MDVGTAKVTAAEARGVPHWLIDIREPSEGFSVADFRREATSCIDAIISRGHLPIVCGGTGLYINSLLAEYHFSSAGGADKSVREKLRNELTLKGSQALHDRLRQVDPVSADRIHPNDTQRLIRALEVWYTEGVPLSSLWEREGLSSPYRPLLIGLTGDREKMYRRIEDRVDDMLKRGLVKEVQSLLDEGVSRDAVSMQGLGYRHISAYLAGEYTLDEAVSLLKRDTRRFAKRQLTWFKRDGRINWFNVDQLSDESELQQKVGALIGRTLERESDRHDGITGTVSAQHD